MRCATCLCVLLLAVVLVVEGRKSFSSRRKGGGTIRRTSQHTPSAPAPAPSHTGAANTNFLNSERAGSSPQSNTHYRGSLFGQEPPKHNVPQTNGPIGFEKLNNPSQNIGFGKVNSDVQQKSGGAHVPSAPAYPAKPPAGAPNGPPPAYPGLGGAPGTHAGGYEPPPAYPGRPVNAPPVYTPNNPSYGQRAPGQPGVGGYPSQQGGYQQSAYPVQPGSYQQGGYHPQQTSYQGQNYQNQQNFGYPNNGGNFGSGFNQGGGGGFSGSYPGGYGQSYSGFGGGSYGGSPFGQSNSYGGSPFSGGFGGNSFGGSGFGNSHYSPNNFGFSGNSGYFGSNHGGFGGGGYNNYGYHKKSRFGGLPIPIPIPIPIPFGGFGGYGRSHNHHVVDSFIKNKTISTSDNETTSVYILNNSTVTPCTTDQFIYDSLNVTVMSCTAANCTAIKVFTTTNVSGEVTEKSASITMCYESNVTYSTHADNINPSVSDLLRYRVRLCKEDGVSNLTGNATEIADAVKVVETVLNETVISVDGVNTTAAETNSSDVVETTTESSVVVDSSTVTTNSSLNATLPSSNSSSCEDFDCYWIKMCLPSMDVMVFSFRTGYEPCVIIRMCKSPSTPINTFATLNTTISRIDQNDNVTKVNDVANLTLISYNPAPLPANCSEGASDPACQPPAIIPQEVCAPHNSTEGESLSSGTSFCGPVQAVTDVDSTVNVTTTESPTTTPVP